jgi:hypothetical protein
MKPVMCGSDFPSASAVHQFYTLEPNKYAFIVTKTSDFSAGFRSDWKSMYAVKLDEAKRLIAGGGRGRKPVLQPSEMESSAAETAVASGGDDEEEGLAHGDAPTPKAKRQKTSSGSRGPRWTCEWCSGSWQAQDRDEHARLCVRVRRSWTSRFLCQSLTMF